ncbi:MAG: TonB-dependent receptor, partial [Candidatus Kapaibacteriota bacterium]
MSQIQISGYIYDQVDNKPLTGARVTLDGTILGAITDKNGRYQISKITPGWYSIIVMLPGYKTFKETVLLSKDTILNYYLQYQDVLKPEIVVTASRRMQVVSDVPVSMSVLEQEYLKNKNYYQLKDYMNFIPSVEVNSDNISIRGSSGFQFGAGSRVTLLLDGFPFLSGDIGEANVNLFPPEIVSRVEVLKGAGSAIYGNSAMGGVINIITKVPDEQTLLRAKVSTGFYTTPKYDEWVYSNKIRTKNSLEFSYLLPRNSMKFLFAAQFLNDESFRKFNRSNSVNFFGKFIKQIGNNSTFSLFALLNYKFSDDASYWKSVQYATLPPDDHDLSSRITKLKVAFGVDFLSTIGKNSFFSAKSSLLATDFESNLPKSNINYRQSASYSNFNEFLITHHLFENSFITTGINVINNWVNSYQYGTRRQSVLSTFTQGEFKMFNKLNATGGIRVDLDLSDS